MMNGGKVHLISSVKPFAERDTAVELVYSTISTTTGFGPYSRDLDS